MSASHPKLNITSLTLGPFATNCYVVSEEGSPDCFIVDASFGGESIVQAVKRQDLKPLALVFTHAHIDHIAGAHAVKRAFPEMPLWIHERETRWLVDSELNLSALGGMPVTAPPHDRAHRLPGLQLRGAGKEHSRQALYVARPDQVLSRPRPGDHDRTRAIEQPVCERTISCCSRGVRSSIKGRRVGCCSPPQRSQSRCRR